MGLTKEPLKVDFVVDPRPLTKAEEIAISEFIRAEKNKAAASKNKKSKTSHQKKEKQKI